MFLATGFTDLRRGIDGLAAIVQQQFELNPFTNTLFLFCGRRRDRIKALYWEGDGFVLLYKRLESGSFQWPRSETEARALTPQQYRWLMTAEIDQLKKKVEAQQAELEAKSAELAQALLQNQWLTEQLLVKKRKLFGSSSEVLDQMVMEQFAHLFNEAECWDAASQKPAAKAEKKPRKRRSSGSVEDIIPEGTPVEVVEHRLPEEQRICSVCGSEMVEIGKEIRRTLQMEPPRFWVREDWYYTYACKHCEQKTGEAVIETTPMEPAVLPGSFASPSAIAHIAVQKFVMYSPLYRLEKEYERQGLKLSRQTMSNWLLHLEHHGNKILLAEVIQFRRKLFHGVPPVTFTDRIIPQNSFYFHYLQHIFRFYFANARLNRQSGHEPFKLFLAHFPDLLCRPGPLVMSVLQALIQQQETVSFPDQILDFCRTAAAKHKQHVFLKRV